MYLALLIVILIIVLGAGSAGASTAYYINKFGSPCHSVNITVYERSHYVGGRSTTVNVYNDPIEPVELGASIFVEVNHNLVSAVREFGLVSKSADEDAPSEPPKSLGVWDGKEFRFIQNEGNYYWWNIAKLMWQYGLAPIRTQRLMKRIVGSFLQMYEEPYFPFRSLSQTAYDLGLTAVTSATGDVFLQQHHISPLFSTDIIQASTRVNYAQNLGEIHGLETMVCMATDGAMAVKGGNWQIFDRMLKTAGANLGLNISVTEVSQSDDGSYVVHATPGMSVKDIRGPLMDQYDSVILATPLQFSNIKLPSSLERLPDEIPYVKLYVSLFASPHRLSPYMFDLSPDSAVPDVVLTTLPGGAVIGDPSQFFSISILRSVKNPFHSPPRSEYLYKIFSPKPVEPSFLSKLLGFSTAALTLTAISKDDISWLYEKSWHSYPYLPPGVTFEDPQLGQNLWYTSGIESFISTMETSSLMGMNVARLIVDDWERRSDAGSEDEL